MRPITLATVRQSNLPRALSLCDTDIPEIRRIVNEAQQRLILAMGEMGAAGGWQAAVFAVDSKHRYITLPSSFARIVNMAFCKAGVRVQNQFYELLDSGKGLAEFYNCSGWRGQDWCGSVQGYDRGQFPTLRDVDDQNQLLAVFPTNPVDIGKQIFIGPCLDQNGNRIYTTVGNTNYDGFFLTLAFPFVVSPMIVTKIYGVQKSITNGDVLLYQQDATSGQQILLSRYGANEQNPSYRRYYLNGVPCGCGSCDVPVNGCASGSSIAPYQYGSFNPNGVIQALNTSQFYLLIPATGTPSVWKATCAGQSNWVLADLGCVQSSFNGNDSPQNVVFAAGPAFIYLDIRNQEFWVSTSAGTGSWVFLGKFPGV